jgi:hypothetical protein
MPRREFHSVQQQSAHQNAEGEFKRVKMETDAIVTNVTVWLGSGVAGAEEFLSILRQPMTTNQSLSCWGWFHPRQLRFGAHDFFQLEEVRRCGVRKVDGDRWWNVFAAQACLVHALGLRLPWQVSTQLEEIVSLPAAHGEDVASLSMETVTMSNGSVTFFHNGVKVGHVLLPRMMTDCINPEAVELGQVCVCVA